MGRRLRNVFRSGKRGGKCYSSLVYPRRQQPCSYNGKSITINRVNTRGNITRLPEEQSFNENNNDEKTDGQQTIEENEEFDELKMQLRKTPRRSSNATTKIREMELLSSFLNEGSKEIKEKCKIKPQEKKRKSSITLATLNESVKKQTYKIRFKVSLNKDNSKSSVLQYLFGCFGGEKLFHQK